MPGSSRLAVYFILNALKPIGFVGVGHRLVVKSFSCRDFKFAMDSYGLRSL